MYAGLAHEVRDLVELAALTAVFTTFKHQFLTTQQIDPKLKNCCECVPLCHNSTPMERACDVSLLEVPFKQKVCIVNHPHVLTVEFMLTIDSTV